MSDAGDPSRPPSRGAGSGLVIKPGLAKYPRPAAGFSGKAVPVSLAGAAELKSIQIESHRALAGKQRDLAARVAAHPDVAVMLLINPVLAFKELGVTFSPEIASHVLHAVQHPAPVRTRREDLEASIKQALGEAAQPVNAVWNSRLLFTLRKLAPLAIGDAKPAYTPPLGQPEAQSLHDLRPRAVLRYPQPRLLPPRTRVSSVPWKESLRRMDLAAPAPRLPNAAKAPAEVPLEDLWFYKDLDKVVHDALELGLIMRSAFPIHSPDSFRKVLSGEQPNAFRSWIKRIRFNPA
jgi:hypothetical protein